MTDCTNDSFKITPLKLGSVQTYAQANKGTGVGYQVQKIGDLP